MNALVTIVGTMVLIVVVFSAMDMIHADGAVAHDYGDTSTEPFDTSPSNNENRDSTLKPYLV